MYIKGLMAERELWLDSQLHLRNITLWNHQHCTKKIGPVCRKKSIWARMLSSSCRKIQPLHMRTWWTAFKPRSHRLLLVWWSLPRTRCCDMLSLLWNKWALFFVFMDRSMLQFQFYLFVVCHVKSDFFKGFIVLYIFEVISSIFRFIVLYIRKGYCSLFKLMFKQIFKHSWITLKCIDSNCILCDKGYLAIKNKT